MVVVSCIAVTLFLGGWLRPFPNLRALDFLNYAPPVAFIGAAAFVLWQGLQSRVPLERRFFAVLAVGFVFIAIVIAYPPVLHAIQGIFWFGAKVLLFLYAFIWYRATFPRYRYDQLMNVGWRWMIPLALVNLIGTAVVRYLLSAHSAASPTAWLGR
jgi:NADH-quinone oxidoreductase subunit H